MLYVFRLSGRIKDWIDAYGVALDSVRNIGDQQAEGHLLHELGIAHYDRKEPGTALDWTEKSLSVFRALGDHAGELATVTSMGPMAVDAGRASEAEPHLQRGLELLGTNIDSEYVAGQLHAGLGMLYAHLQHTEDALWHLQEARQLNARSGEQFGEGFVLNYMADTYFVAGNVDQAIDCYRRAAELRAEIGHRGGQAVSLRSLGTALRYSGDAAGAQRAWEESLALFEDLGSPEADELRAELASATG